VTADDTDGPGADLPGPDFLQLPDLASRLIGGAVVFANDDLFAERENLIKHEEPVYSPHTFGHKGQVYDGWETRRHREPGHDWALVRLGVPGVVRGVVVDTAFFTGNYPPEISVEGAAAEGHLAPAELNDIEWFPLVRRSPARGHFRNAYPVEAPERVTHVRLCQYPDGGVARLRVHGTGVPDPRFLTAGTVDLAALENGGTVVGCSNMFYSAPSNLILPGPARVMGEGWETSRRRDDGNDWVELALAGPGAIRVVELDTSYFLGNSPGWARLTGYDARAGESLDDAVELLDRRRLQPDTRHRFLLPGDHEVTHVRLDIYPDGGMARVRLWGELTPSGREDLVLHWYNLLPSIQLVTLLTESYGVDHAAAQAAAARRPTKIFADLPAVLQSSLP
jgi:allantoicase